MYIIAFPLRWNYFKRAAQPMVCVPPSPNHTLHTAKLSFASSRHVLLFYFMFCNWPNVWKPRALSSIQPARSELHSSPPPPSAWELPAAAQHKLPDVCEPLAGDKERKGVASSSSGWITASETVLDVVTSPEAWLILQCQNKQLYGSNNECKHVILNTWSLRVDTGYTVHFYIQTIKM